MGRESPCDCGEKPPLHESKEVPNESNLKVSKFVSKYGNLSYKRKNRSVKQR